MRTKKQGAQWVVAVALAAAAVRSHGIETVESRIESVGMFKNGLSIIRRTVRVPGPGTYQLARLPEPVHGTWWIESDVDVITRVTRLAVEVPLEKIGQIDFQRDLAGSEVTVYFADTSIPPATGRVVESNDEGAAAWDRQYETTADNAWYYRSGFQHRTGAPPQPRFLVLRTDQGTSYIERGRIATIQEKGSRTSVTRQEPAMLFEVRGAEGRPATIGISYLTKGLAWAPSYRVDLSGDAELVLRQKAVIRNELEPLAGAELVLISGYPSIQFSHVVSPLSGNTSWATFFSQLNQQIRPGRGAGHAMTQQRLVVSNLAALGRGVDIAAVPHGEGVDLHYHPVGPHDLGLGDTLDLAVASASAAYERIVEWIIPDTRRPNGRSIEEHERERDPQRYDDSAWDAVQFRNPFDFPMTTGPAMVVDGDRFNGQRMSYWSNPGEQAVLHITKALSLRTRHTEVEEPGEREIVHVGGQEFRKVRVRGEVLANNHRAEEIDLVVRRRFSGELVEAGGSPRQRLLESGVYAVNKRNELVWTVTVPPGGEAKQEYTYDVLVYH